MTAKYPPISDKCPHMLHGGDYNPDQWLHRPDILDDDMRLMQLAGCNAMSIGIFAWAALEPAEGQFQFDWLDRTMDRLADAGGYAVLATPTAARPAWMSFKYPEVRRVTKDGRREPHRERHNFCRTSPIYREKATIINTKLAERYKDHPALIVWHINNEYNGGECHCELCYAAFRDWLRKRFNNDLDQLNHAWWTAFWAHTYTDWNQIEPHDHSVHGLALDWKRFTSDQTVDFFKHESQPLRDIAPDIPVTTNLMGFVHHLNYCDMAKACDVISWDAYPNWCQGNDEHVAAHTAMGHDLNRSLGGGKPFMLMECAPSSPQWGQPRKRKRPGMHRLSSLQAIAHGSDTVQYFQWRKSRGSHEKWHGAVVDHVGHESTRVFRDVAQLGDALAKLDDVVGTTVPAKVAIIHDWHNRWAIEIGGSFDSYSKYLQDLLDHYKQFWQRGIPVDIIESTADLSDYTLVVAPMLYMLREGVGKALADYVQAGGTLVTTYASGCVDENDLCFLGGFPGGELRDVLGIWNEELDILMPDERNPIVPADGNAMGLVGTFEGREFCAIVHAEGATTLASYGGEFYAGSPALTVNDFGKGQAYYLATRADGAFLDAFYGRLTEQLNITGAIDADLPAGVNAMTRTDGKATFTFVMNFNETTTTVGLGNTTYTDMLTGSDISGTLELPGYGAAVLRNG